MCQELTGVKWQNLSVTKQTSALIISGEFVLSKVTVFKIPVGTISYKV
jgi:hypothetical protein